MSDAQPLIGYQAWVDWMGTPVLTLADVWPEHPRAMVVGLNPAPASVEVGHYYQGNAGRRQLGRLVSSGLFALPEHRAFFEKNALAAGVGFTDIVKRPTAGERDIPSGEIQHGVGQLARSLAERDVGLVICVFRQPVAALLGSKGAAGFQNARTSWGARVFRMPGPYAAADAAQAVMTELTDAWREH